MLIGANGRQRFASLDAPRSDCTILPPFGMMRAGEVQSAAGGEATSPACTAVTRS
jgi:hypothetical protein